MDPLMFKALWELPVAQPADRVRESRTPLRPRLAEALRRAADLVDRRPALAAPAGC